MNVHHDHIFNGSMNRIVLFVLFDTSYGEDNGFGIYIFVTINTVLTRRSGLLFLIKKRFRVEA